MADDVDSIFYFGMNFKYVIVMMWTRHLKRDKESIK